MTVKIENQKAISKQSSTQKGSGSKVYQNKEKQAEVVANKFVRVGIKIFRIAYEPSCTKSITGENITYTKTLKQWNKVTLEDDYGKPQTSRIMEKMLKAVSYSVIPSHTDYQQVIEGKEGDLFYNLYEPIPFQPSESTKCAYIMQYLSHVFGDQLEEGLDYLQIMYLYPTQKLPILALVSKERETAKTTFLNLLVKIFGNNAHFIRGEDFNSSFNSDWASKLCICLDDVDLRVDGISHRIRGISTSDTLPVEAKGKDRINAPFFGKIILTSNKYNNFAFVDNEENRFWVRYVPTLPKEEKSPHFLDEKIVPEIPAFLNFLINRKMKHPKPLTRMWLPYDAIHTEWLDQVKANSASIFEQELVDFLTEMFEALPKENELKYGVRVLRGIIQERAGKKLSENYFKKLTWERFGIKPSKGKNERYPQYIDFEQIMLDKEGNATSNKSVEVIGKPLTFTREMLGLEPEDKVKGKLEHEATKSQAEQPNNEVKPDECPF